MPSLVRNADIRTRFASFASKRSVLRGRFDQNHMPNARLEPMVFLLVLVAFTPVFGQDADSDRLLELLKPVPQLPVERINLKVNPPLEFEGISAVTSDRRGNIYVIHRPANGDPIVVLDPQGNFIRSWGKGMFKIPHGIRIDPAGNVWALDAHTSMVYKFTPEGKKLLEIGVGDVPDRTQEFCGATDIAFAKDGHVFVTDGYCNARVVEYDAAGKKVRQWGQHGAGPGEFALPHSIAISSKGQLYIADRDNGRLQWFDRRGKFLGQWKYGGQFWAVAFSRTGEFYAATHPKNALLDSEFNVVKIDLASGKIVGKFEVRSHELAVAPDGTLLPGTRSSQLVLLKPRK
jgi:DNA-binding beta-propeller fold protein YncE